jgi:hypothetical protein
VRTRARLERLALVVGQPAVTLLGVNDPGRNASLAQPLGGTIVPTQPTHVFAQPRLRVPRNVLAKVLAQLGLAIGRHRDALDHRGRALGQHGGRQSAQHAAEPDERAEDAGSSFVDKLIPSKTAGPAKATETTISSATAAPMLKPTTTSAPTFVASSDVSRA